MTPILVGYFPRRTLRRADAGEAGFPAPGPVEEVASVSRCLSRPADAELDTYDPESAPLGGFADVESARVAVPEADRDAFDLYAYRVYPLRFEDGQVTRLDLPPRAVAPMPGTFVRLGFDAVEVPGGDVVGFGCSPLSCNGLAGVHGPVNRACLAPTLAEALELARRFSVDRPEPGPYAVAEVWRDEAGRPARAEAVLRAVPTLRVADVGRSLAWYAEMLGFEADPFPAEPPFQFAILRTPAGAELMLRRGRPPDRERPGPYDWDVYLRIDGGSLLAAFGRLQSAGAIARRMERMPYGLAEFEAVDPDGHVLCLSGEPIGAEGLPTPEG